MNKQIIERIAEVGHGTVRAFGIASGTTDLPTWQILPSAEKEGYREAVEFALSETVALAADPITERLARRTYENEMRFGPNRISKSTEEVGWNELSESSRMQWRLVAAVTRVFAMSQAVAVPGTSVPAKLAAA